MKTCRPLAPTESADIQICEFAIICQRCRFCFVHCTCPPEDQRAATDDYKRNRSGSLVLKPGK